MHTDYSRGVEDWWTAMVNGRTRTIYGLFALNPSTGEKDYFYVGRSVDVLRRLRQHRWRTDTGHEDLYVYLRQLDVQGRSWDKDDLRVIAPDDYPPDGERWFVIKLIREGHRLMNMRYGSEEHRRELAEQVGDTLRIRSIQDVSVDRERRALQCSKKLRRRVLESTLRRKGIYTQEDAKVLAPGLRQRVARYPLLLPIFPGTPLKEVVFWARRAQKTRRFHERVKPLVRRPCQLANGDVRDQQEDSWPHSAHSEQRRGL